MTKTFCDRCGYDISQLHQYGTLDERLKIGAAFGRHYVFCETCATEALEILQKWLERAPVAVNPPC